MSTSVAVDDPRISVLEPGSRLAAAALLVLGGGVLLGWAFDIALLIAVVPGFETMKVNTAAAFVLVALSLASRRGQGRARAAVASGCAALVVLIGVLTLAQYALGAPLGIDEWLFSDTRTPRGIAHPGRMAPFTALGFVLLGFAAAAVGHVRTVAVGQWLALVVAYLGVLNLVGSLYRLQGLTHVYSPAGAYAEMAVHTAAGFVVAGGGLLCARPGVGMMAVVTSDTVGGMVARRLLPAVLGLPFVLGWLRLLGERAGVWSFQAGWAFLAFATLTLFLIVVWASVRALHRTDIARRQTEAALRQAHDQLEARVQERTHELAEAVHVLDTEGRVRKDVEQALQESERRYRTLVESSRGLICIHDLDGVLLSVNPSAARVLGYEPDELVGKPLRELLAPAVRHLFAAYLERIRHTSSDEGVLLVLTRHGGQRVWAYSNVRYEEPGRAPYVLGHAQDITELKRAEKLARQAETLRSVAALANAAAHEINNPLTVVTGQLEMLKRRIGADPEALTRIEKAKTAVQRITDIVGRMARITRIEHLGTHRNLPPLLDLRRSGASEDDPAPPADDRPATPDG